ncbi:hypothetical protein K474DRAFT_1597218, partial [Panus rudis PR-1116 ss-1]
LPQEIQDYILDFLHEDRGALRAASLVSKSWRPSAQLHLFRKLTIHNREHSRIPIDSASARCRSYIDRNGAVSDFACTRRICEDSDHRGGRWIRRVGRC